MIKIHTEKILDMPMQMLSVRIPRSNSSCLFDTFLLTTDLSRWLIKPGLHVSLPILMEMAIWDHIIPFTHG